MTFGRVRALQYALYLVALCTAGARGATFQFTNITDLPGGPGSGAAPSINNKGNIAFYDGSTIYYYDRGAGTFLNLMTLAGAPTQGWFPRVNESGNIAFIDPSTRNVWFFQAATQTFTNLATIQGYPGNTLSNDLNPVFDINDHDKISFHSGDNNLGDVYVYDHNNGTFSKVTDQPGGPTRGRENRINNFDQVAYHGFPDTYVWDPTDSATVNITDLPGGPGAGFSGFSLNDVGDVAVYRPDEITYYDAGTGSFLYFSSLPTFPPGNASVTRNDISDRGGMSFWRDEIFYFDPLDSSFTQLTNQGPVPFPGLESGINDRDEIAFTAGGDVWLAVMTTPSGIATPNRGRLLLGHNVPNPFNPSTVIPFFVPAGGAEVRLEIFDAGGRRVRTLVDGDRPPGWDRVVWDGRDRRGHAVSSGVYFCRFTVDGRIATRKMALVK